MPGTLRTHLLTFLSAIIDYLRFTVFGGQTLWTFIDSILLFFVDACRLFCGRWLASGIERCARPAKPLILYEFEGCPYCRKVRETFSVLGIDHIVYPCPRETLKSAGVCLNSRHRPQVLKRGGSLKFPFLVDPNNNRQLYESDDIVRYLWTTYGASAQPPINYKLAFHPCFLGVSMALCSFCRPCIDMGILRAPSHSPEKQLELWGYESSACVRRVREVLTMLELPYLYHEMGFGASAKREEFRKAYGERFSNKKLRNKLGWIQVPFLKDPNTGTELFDSVAIVHYLRQRYQTATLPTESWSEYGINDTKKVK